MWSEDSASVLAELLDAMVLWSVHLGIPSISGLSGFLKNIMAIVMLMRAVEVEVDTDIRFTGPGTNKNCCETKTQPTLLLLRAT